MKEVRKVIRGYKGFDKDMNFLGFQYEVGKSYKCKIETACAIGFFFCENPLDVLEYCPPSSNKGVNRLCIVEGSGEFDISTNRAFCTKLKVIREISLQELIEDGLKRMEGENTVIRKTGNYSVTANTENGAVATGAGNFSVSTGTGSNSAAFNNGLRSVSLHTGYGSASLSTGDSSNAVTTGEFSEALNTGNFGTAVSTGNNAAAMGTGKFGAAISTGDGSSAANTGEFAAAVSTGEGSSSEVDKEDSIAVSTGMLGKAKGVLGSWLVLTERDGRYRIKSVKSFKVDGETIKPDTFYKLVDGEAVEA